MTKGLEKKNEIKGSLKGAIEPTAIKIVTRNFEADLYATGEYVRQKLFTFPRRVIIIGLTQDHN